ncbi:hypothetical protein D3C83_277340 [compost metagenome]
MNGGSQRPLAVLHASGAVQPVMPQPGSHLPVVMLQRFEGGPHAASFVHTASPGSQRPVLMLHVVLPVH